MLFSILFCSISLGILGFLIKEKKKYNLISSYNTLSSKEKANVNIEKFANTLGIVFYCLSGIFIVICICAYFSIISDVFILMLSFFFTFFAFNIIVFKRENKETRNPKTIIFLLVFDFIGMLAILFLLFKSIVT